MIVVVLGAAKTTICVSSAATWKGILFGTTFPVQTQRSLSFEEKNIKRALEFFYPGNEAFVCPNHFVDGKPTINNPHLTLSLLPSDRDRTVVASKKTHSPKIA